MNSRPKILVVDDEPRLLKGFSRLLRAAEYEVLTATSGEEGVRKARDTSPDLVLMDVSLPGIDGVEACERIKCDQSLTNTYVVLISGSHTSADHQATGLEAGADGYMTKPIANREFLARVKAMLRIKETETNLANALKELRAIEDALRRQNAELRETQKQLEVSRKKYEGLYDFAPLGYCTLDTQGIIQEANLTLAEQLGLDRDKLVGTSLMAYIAEEDCDFFVTHLKDTFHSGGKSTCDIKLIKADGMYYYAHLEGLIVHNIEDAPPQCRVALTDITERKEIEAQKQREAEVDAALSALYEPLISPSSSMLDITSTILEQVRLLTHSAHGYVSSIDPVTGDNVSHTLTKMLKDGCNVVEEDQRFIFPKEADGYPTLWGHALNTKQAFYTNTPATHPASTGIPEGHIPIQCFLTMPVLLGDELVGQIALANADREYTDYDLESIRHVAEFYALAIQRLRYEDALRESEARFRTMFEGTSDGIILANKETREFKFVNRAMCELLGYDEATLTQMRVEDLHPADALPLVLEYFEELALGERSTALDVPVKRQDGAILYADISGRSMYIDNQEYLMGVFRDVTGRKEAEQALARYTAELKRSNEDLAQFSYIVSHDLQEPLRMITSYLGLLERRYKNDLDAKANEYINYAVDGATRMRNLIRDLLEYSRIDTRGQPPEPTDTEAILGEVLQDLQLVIQDCDAVVTHTPLPVVLADTVQLRQLFQNLISNALKFHPPETECRGELPRVHIQAEKQGSMYVFSIQDNGIGIAEEYFERIFGIFQRLHTRKEYAGTGIGLAICKKIVERHGGQIWVKSEVGQGTTFYFSLPEA